MARKTFFCFRYDQDYWRAINVRNSWIGNERIAAGFFEPAEWEDVKKEPDSVIENWIDSHLHDTSVTVVLIGADTAGKKWIEHEIKRSQAKGNGILGIYIHDIKDKKGNTSARGANPFHGLIPGEDCAAPDYPVYDWIKDDGYHNMDHWIEEAAKAAGK
jgi:hypothetical protein